MLSKSGSDRTSAASNELSLNYRLRRLFAKIVPPCTHFAFNRTPLNFDRAYNVDTQAAVPVAALDIAGHHADAREGYAPISVKHFAFAMGLVPPPLDAWSFIDIGSGKGRAVLLAAGYPFRRVIGVELAPELHTISQENLRRCRGPRRCQAVELVCGNATSHPLPPGDVVVFFYNSFHGVLLHRFLNHLEASLRATPRRLLFVYSNPTERAAVESRRAFVIRFAGASPYDMIWWGNRRLVVYGAGLEDRATSPNPMKQPAYDALVDRL